MTAENLNYEMPRKTAKKTRAERWAEEKAKGAGRSAPAAKR